MLHISGLTRSSPAVHTCIKQLLTLVIISNMWNGRKLIKVWFIGANMWTVNRAGSSCQYSQYGELYYQCNEVCAFCWLTLYRRFKSWDIEGHAFVK